MTRISRVHAYELLDSRGNPTVGVRIELEDEHLGDAIVPSGASVGTNEAIELRDADPERYGGKGVLGVLENIKTKIAPALLARRSFDQSDLDATLVELDGSDNKSNLGANGTLGVSLAFARACARKFGKELYEYIHDISPFDAMMRMPVPMMNVINGGAHANNRIDLQEFMIVPVGAKSMASAIRFGSEVFHSLKSKLSKSGYSTAVGDEGGFAPDLNSDFQALKFLVDATKAAGYQTRFDVSIALDPAASEFFKDGNYVLKSQKTTYSPSEYCEYLEKIMSAFQVISVEDGLSENDWDTWQSFTKKLGDFVQLVGDDIFVTNRKFLQQGIDRGIGNAILIKPNQIGTLTETLDVIGLAKSAHYKTVISHRSGDTEDTFIADLAVGTGAGQIKSGSLCRSERTAKYNRLIRIEAHAGHLEYWGFREFL